LHALALDAIQQLDFSRPGWAKQMDAIIARGHTAAAIAAAADRANVKVTPGLFKGLSRAERKDIDALVREQRKYLTAFVAAAEGLSEAQIAARAGLYAGAVRQTYYSQRWGDWIIPPELLPGNQTCITNCKCRISVRDNDDGTGELTREMGGTEDHCDECPALVGTYPVKRQHFVQKDFDGWDDSEIDTWGDPVVTLKHGSHDQSTHGRSTGRRVASRSAYSAARAGGASVQDARLAAKATSEYLARAQRMENIIKQQAGYMSPAQRRSSEAELQRLANAQDTYLDRVPAHLQGHVNDAISRAPVTTPTVRGRSDPRPAAAARQAGHSPAARDAHARVLDAENATSAQKDNIHFQRRRLMDEKADLYEQRATLTKQRLDAIGDGDDARELALDKDIAKIDRRAKRIQVEDRKLVDQLRSADADLQRSILQVDNPAKFTAVFDHNMTATDKLSVGGALMQASRMTSTKGLDGRPIAIRVDKGVRAYATDFGPDFRQSGEIVLANDAHRVAAHEFGHHIEFRNPEVKRRATEFLDRRTAGETARPLAEITNNSNYRAGEVAQSDKFINPYMGKRYNDGSTEIISMGLEYFFSDPLKLAKDDPDYFMFMYDVLRA
jgi:hypothetical protein